MDLTRSDCFETQHLCRLQQQDIALLRKLGKNDSAWQVLVWWFDIKTGYIRYKSCCCEKSFLNLDHAFKAHHGLIINAKFPVEVGALHFALYLIDFPQHE